VSETNLQGIALGDAVAAVNKLPALNPLPRVVQQSAGDADIMQEIFSRFAPLWHWGDVYLCHSRLAIQ